MLRSAGITKLYKLVHYLIFSKEKSDELGVPSVQWRTNKIPRKCYTTNYYTSSILTELNLSARKVLDVVLEQMTIENEISNNAEFKKLFNKGRKKDKFHKSTINKAFASLLKYDVIISTSSRGIYIVNPEYYWRGTEKDRIQFIRKRLEQPVVKLAYKYRSAKTKKQPK